MVDQGTPHIFTRQDSLVKGMVNYSRTISLEIAYTGVDIGLDIYEMTQLVTQELRGPCQELKVVVCSLTVTYNILSQNLSLSIFELTSAPMPSIIFF